MLSYTPLKCVFDEYPMFIDYNTALVELNTIADFLRFGLSQANQCDLYYGHGTDNAWDDLYCLILGSLKLPLDMEPIYLQAKLTMPEKQFLAAQLKKRILEHVPVPYLTNEAHFAGHTFYVDERVLIPRSPFAELIEQRFSPWVVADQVHEVLDLCTGSGCIAIACAYAFPEAHVDGVDISPEALAVAKKNVMQHHLEERVTLIESNVWDKVPKKQYDLIVSNPPYVSHDEMTTLPKEYAHEPSLALVAKRNGLEVVDVILAHARDHLTPDGVLVIEVGNTEEALIEAYPDLPFTWLDLEHGGHGIFVLTADQI
jgi:ribosomal protein L3 glutamine methyltransferase